MITIPTGDLTGVLADVLPFVSPDEDLPMLNAVRVEWDGKQLHALATDRYRVAWSTWDPDDDPIDGEVQDDLFTTWGGADAAWTITVPADDVGALVKNYRLPKKEQRTPLTVGYETGRLQVARARETGHSALTAVVDGLDGPNMVYPDLRKFLSDHDVLELIDHAMFSARYMADFAKVRNRGPMELKFTSVLTHVSIGPRFVGAIMPIRG